MFSAPLLMAIAIHLADPFQGSFTADRGNELECSAVGHVFRHYQEQYGPLASRYYLMDDVDLELWLAVDVTWELYWSPICYGEAI